MGRSEQKLTVSSPLSLLTKPGVLRQETLPGFAAPRDTSRFSVARLAYILGRPVQSIHAFRTRTGGQGHTLRTEHTSGASSTLSWSEGERKTFVASAELPGEVKMTQEGKNVVFTSETGATIRYMPTGAFLYSPTPLRRTQEQDKQADTPWYLKSAEAVGRSGIRLENIAAEIVEAPSGVGVTKGNIPVARFTLRLLNTSEPAELVADVYNDKTRERGGNPYRIQQTLNKKLHQGDRVVFTGHYHIDRTTFQNEHGVKPYERRWVRLLVIDKKPTG